MAGFSSLLPIFLHQPPTTLKLDSQWRTTSEVRSSKGQRMTKRPQRSASAILTFTQPHTNWQKEEERKEQSVPSGQVTFSPAANQVTGTDVCVIVCRCLQSVYVCLEGWDAAWSCDHVCPLKVNAVIMFVRVDVVFFWI